MVSALIALALLGAVAAIAYSALVFYLALFGPEVPYEVLETPEAPIDSGTYRSLLAALTDSQCHNTNEVTVLTNGNEFYPAQLAAIRDARRTISLEAYIIQRGRIATEFLAALTERAQAGVKVKLILDYIGSFGTFKSYFHELLAAGGRVEWYNPPKLHLLPQINNRTHREMLIVDGQIGFIGGAGIADQWNEGSAKHPRWRDTVVRVTGPAMPSLQSVFADNWLQVAGEILTGSEYFHFGEGSGHTAGMIINGTPAQESTRARILYQLLIASAQKRICINTPYFLPDHYARKAVVKAIQDRGVEVTILTPGKHADHFYTRGSSRYLYGRLLKHGVKIFEYQPAMIHVKVMIVDDLWAVVGSTNFDHRSFGLNDEVNFAISDAAVAARLLRDFEHDLESSEEFTYQRWRSGYLSRVWDWMSFVFNRQQ